MTSSSHSLKFRIWFEGIEVRIPSVPILNVLLSHSDRESEPLSRLLEISKRTSNRLGHPVFKTIPGRYVHNEG